MSPHSIIVVRFLPHNRVNYFQILEALMCLEYWLWTNMEGNEINTFK